MASTNMFGTYLDTLSSASGPDPATPTGRPFAPDLSLFAPAPQNAPADDPASRIIKVLRLSGPVPVPTLMAIPNLGFQALVTALEQLQATQLVSNQNGVVALTKDGLDAADRLPDIPG